MNDEMWSSIGSIDLEQAKREAAAFAEEAKATGMAPPLTKIEALVDNIRRWYAEEDQQEIISRLRGMVVDKKADEIIRSKVSRWAEGKSDAEIAAQVARHNSFEGWRTGIAYVDDALMGIRGGEVTVIAGSTNVGKTSFALNVATSVCTAAHKRVLYLSLEMAKEQIENWVANIVPSHQYDWLRKGFSVQENRKAGLNELGHMLKNERPDLLVIDHLQFLAKHSPGKSEYDKMSHTTEQVHDLALTYRVPIFVISHMNREATRSDKLLTMFDAKGSGSIEGDADSFISLNRDKQNVENREIVVRLDKCRGKFSPEMYQQFKVMRWEGQRLADSGAYSHFEPGGIR